MSERVSKCPLCQTQLYARGTLFYILKSLLDTNRFFTTIHNRIPEIILALQIVLLLESFCLGAAYLAPLAGSLVMGVTLWKTRQAAHGDPLFQVFQEYADDAVDGSQDGNVADLCWASLGVSITFLISCGLLKLELVFFRQAFISMWTLWWTGKWPAKV